MILMIDRSEGLSNEITMTLVLGHDEPAPEKLVEVTALLNRALRAVPRCIDQMKIQRLPKPTEEPDAKG